MVIYIPSANGRAEGGQKSLLRGALSLGASVEERCWQQHEQNKCPLAPEPRCSPRKLSKQHQCQEPAGSRAQGPSPMARGQTRHQPGNLQPSPALPMKPTRPTRCLGRRFMRSPPDGTEAELCHSDPAFPHRVGGEEWLLLMERSFAIWAGACRVHLLYSQHTQSPAHKTYRD